MIKAPEKKIRVLVADDSAFMCKVLKEIINSDAQLEVAGTARDGREAVALAESLRPDVITMDINMPHLDGLQATELIMSQHPRPVVIVSSESREGAASTLRALELGAIDFVPKPTNGIDLDMRNIREELTRKLKMAAKVRVVRTAAMSKLTAHAPVSVASALANNAQHGASNGTKFPLVVIAASTGGPAAVMRVVAGLPKDLQAAVLLVLHMPAAFTSQFTIQLAEISRLPVKEAESPAAPSDLPLPRRQSLANFIHGKNHPRRWTAHRRLSPLRRRRSGIRRRLRAPAHARRSSRRNGQRRFQGCAS